MRKVINEEELKLKMHEAINLLCTPVKKTLGPKGSNIIIDHSTLSPFITNDGVTIASNIESDDPIINTILELAKEASIKTNETVGDGTTTTLVLLESLYNAGEKLIKEGVNPLILKKELNNCLEIIIPKIIASSDKPRLSALKSIATIASNSKEIGTNLIKAYQKVGSSNIYLEESLNETTTITHTKGYVFDTLLASPYFLKSLESKLIKEPYVLITNEEINTTEEISSILEFIMENKENLIIIAKDYDSYFVNTILNLFLENKANIMLLKSPGYGLEELAILEDIATISKGKIMNTSYSPVNLGKIPQALITKNETNFNFIPSKEIMEYLKTIRDSTLSSKRTSMLKNGFITFSIGSPTLTEAKEKKMRYEDALWALKMAKDGVIPGSGLILAKISYELNNENYGATLLKKALQAPLTQILTNAALEPAPILEQLKNNGFTTIFNVKSNQFEALSTTSVIDPTIVVITALKNAVSIASMLLTTTSLIINEQPPNLSLDNFNI